MWSTLAFEDSDAWLLQPEPSSELNIQGVFDDFLNVFDIGLPCVKRSFLNDDGDEDEVVDYGDDYDDDDDDDDEDEFFRPMKKSKVVPDEVLPNSLVILANSRKKLEQTNATDESLLGMFSPRKPTFLASSPTFLDQATNERPKKIKKIHDLDGLQKIQPSFERKLSKAKNLDLNKTTPLPLIKREEPLSTASTASTTSTMDSKVCLGADFEPGNWDVVCGRGKNWLEYVSNRRFRVLVAIYLRDYFETVSRTRKSVVIDTIVKTVQQAGKAGFIRKDCDGKWFRITNKEAREKVSHCLRDCLTDPQNDQFRWSLEQRQLKLKEAQNNVFRSLDLMF